MLVGVLAIWCFLSVCLMFFGNAWTDTIGLVLTAAEALYIVSRDREGFYTGAGFFKVAEWSRGRRIALAVIEIPFFFIALIVYVIRIAALQYQLLDQQQPAPLTPPAKRRQRPRQ